METANITYQDEDGNIKVKIDHDQCIVCGRCVTACKHDARDYVDDTARFFDDLKNGVSLSLMTAPSFRTSMPDYKRLFTYLKRLGINKVYDVSLGLDGGTSGISKKTSVRTSSPNPCPVVVSYCERYRHDLLKYISLVHSPMACASIYMKKYVEPLYDIDIADWWIVPQNTKQEYIANVKMVVHYEPPSFCPY